MIEGLTTIHSQQSKQQGQISRQCFISLFVFLSLLYYGFVCNKIYKLEFFSLFSIRINENDDNEHWYHTWWIRFVFVTVMAWSTLIAFSCFPRHIKGDYTNIIYLKDYRFLIPPSAPLSPPTHSQNMLVLHFSLPWVYRDVG